MSDRASETAEQEASEASRVEEEQVANGANVVDVDEAAPASVGNDSTSDNHVDATNDEGTTDGLSSNNIASNNSKQTDHEKPSTANVDPVAPTTSEPVGKAQCPTRPGGATNVVVSESEAHIKAEIGMQRQKFEEKTSVSHSGPTSVPGAFDVTPTAPSHTPNTITHANGGTEHHPAETTTSTNARNSVTSTNVDEILQDDAIQPLPLGQNAMDDMPPPPDLARGPRAQRQPAEPGAYRHRGIGRASSSSGASVDDSASLAMGTTDGDAANNNNINNRDADTPLLEATLVASEPFQNRDTEEAVNPIAEAEMLEPKSLLGQWSSTSLQGKVMCLLVVAVVLGLGTTGIVCGASNVCGKGGNENNDVDGSNALGGNNNNNNNNQVPTLAPTGYWVVDLPDFTLAALEDPLSSQSQSYHWMMDGYGPERLEELPDWRRSQIFAIGCFYYAFDGSTRPGLLREVAFFNTSYHECDWTGRHVQLECTDEGQVTFFRITVSPVDIVGTIPPEIVLLDALTTMSVTRVKLIGILTDIIPTEMAMLESLVNLDLSSNQVDGTIPPYMADMTHLESINLHRNRLVGTIPNELMYGMPKLTELKVSSNSLSGTIPKPPLHLLPQDSAGDSLVDVWPDNNGQTDNSSTIDWEDGSGLSLLSLEGNNSSSSSVTKKTEEDFPPLESLEIHSNDLTGTIPPELSYLRNLENFLLSSNDLTGPIPSELGLLSNMKRLRFHTNELTGKLPTELGLMTQMTYLSFSNLLLTGTLPSELALMSNLRYLNLGGITKMEGSIPSEFGLLLTKLTHLTVAGGMTGSVPESICQMTMIDEEEEEEDNGGDGDQRQALSLTIDCNTMDECPVDSCKCECGAEEPYQASTGGSSGSGGSSGGGSSGGSGGASSSGGSGGSGSGGSGGGSNRGS